MNISLLSLTDKQEYAVRNILQSLEYSTSKDEGCEMLYENNEYEDYRNDMEDRVSTLEGALCHILDLLED